MRRTAAIALLVLFWAGCDVPYPRPDPVGLVSPASGSVVVSPVVTLNWLSASDAELYRVRVTTDPDFDSFHEDTLDGTSIDYQAGIDAHYYWRVYARNSNGVWSDRSETWTFILERFRVVATAATQGYAQDIWVEGDRACIADGQAGLAVFDVSNPLEPQLLGVVMDSLNEAYGVVISDSYAYVAYGYKELLIADLSDPESLAIVGELEYPQPGHGYDIAHADSLVYIAADAQFIVVNVKNPPNPDLRFQYRYPRGCRGVALQDSFCFLALEQIGVAIWNVSELPPSPVGSFDTPSNARSVAAEGDYLYVADGRGGLIVVDVSDPASPQTVATCQLEGYAERVTVSDTLAFVGCRDDGIAVFNVTEPESPRLVAQIATSYVRTAQRSGGYLFACDRDQGLVVIEIKGVGNREEGEYQSANRKVQIADCRMRR